MIELWGDYLIYFLLWFFFTATTFGIWVPGGFFIPGILMGCSLGMLYLNILLSGFNMSLLRAGGQSYLVIGTAAMLAGYTRMTYSLAVILMETTNSLNLFIPIFLTMTISNFVGS